MMTSVTLPSGVFPPNAVANDASTDDSTPDFDTPPQRPAKRCLSSTTIAPSSFAPSSPATATDSCKKRRKQAMPVRISAEDSTDASIPSPEEQVSTTQKCPICHLTGFTSTEDLQTHLTNMHCKIEPDQYEEEEEEEEEEENSPWMASSADVSSNKDWLNSNLLTFPGANHLFMGLPPFAPAETLPPRQPIRIFNPDAYCELCNKEFCNKYFLKTHKANKHGIYTDPPPPPTLVLTNEPIAPPPIVKVETNQFTNKLLTKPMTNAPLPFVFNGAESQDLDDGHVEGTCPSPKSPPGPMTEHATSSQIKQEPSGHVDSDLAYTSPGQVNRELDLMMSNHRLRRIGVMNPKAFCEICCKEYCNKYFLRTHKMKRHGIYIPDDKETSSMSKEPASATAPHIQTSPLNLIVGEQPAPGGGDRKTSSSSPSDISCDTCGIRFQNASLFQLHTISVHGKQMYDERKPDTDKADSISEDLQKLQTMILQLNELDVGRIGGGPCVCGVCGKEFENRHALQAHTLTEHGVLMDEAAEKPETNNTINNNTMCCCELCGKDFANAEGMRRHMLDVHKPSTDVVVKEETRPMVTPEAAAAASGRGERRSSTNVTPTSSYCEICNKELCNKYFMKTHMQRMHGIEIENGAQIGGVVCDICNKELCSKYFLRVHKHNTHGIVECGSTGSGTGSIARKLDEANVPPSTEPTPTVDSALKPGDLADLSHRYFTHFTEVCTLCGRRFRSTKWLKAHLLSDHGQAGADRWAELEQHQVVGGTPSKHSRCSPSPLKIPANDATSQSVRHHHQQQQQKLGLQNVLSTIFGADETPTKSYNCSFCPFTTPILPFLFVHERSHTLQAGGVANDTTNDTHLKCPICLQTFAQPELLQHHIFSQHPFLPLPPFFSKEPDSKTSKKRKLAEDIGKQLKETARSSQLPVAYALPQHVDDAEDALPSSMSASFIMQAFRVQEQRSSSSEEDDDDAAAAPSFMPSIVFLPVSQKLSAPITATFTLTPA